MRWAGGAFSISDYYTNTLGTFSPSTKGYKSVDVSGAVNAWVNGTANRGLVLVSTGTDGGDAKYYNEENTTANTDPYLRVVYLVQTGRRLRRHDDAGIGGGYVCELQ